MHQLIDVHHHIIPPCYREALEKKFGLNKQGNIQLPQCTEAGVKFPDWSWESSQELMQKYQIRSAITSISAPGVYFGDIGFAISLARQCNEYAADQSRAQPKHFGAFATLPLPDIKAALQELDYTLDHLNMDGVVLLSNYDEMLLGNPHFEALYQALNARNTNVFIHPTTPMACCADMSHLPPTMFEFVCDTSRTIIHLLTAGVFDRYPRINFIVPHAGGVIPYLAGRLKLYEVLVPHIFKLAPQGVDYYLKRLYYDTAMSTARAQLRCLTDYIPFEQIVVGTDYPFIPDAGLNLVLNGLKDCDFITDKQRELIYSKNMLRLFPKLKGH